MAERYSLIFETEIAALKALSGNAAKALIFVKFGGAEDRSVGCREVAEGTGLSKDQAARGLRELVGAGLLKVTHAGRYGRKGNVSKYRITHTPASKREPVKSHQCDTPDRFSRTSATKRSKSVAPARLKPQNQSHQCDTLKNASSASPQRRKDEEEGDRSEARRRAERDQNMRIGQAAEALQITSIEFRQKAGGWEAADFLAKRFASGKLTLPQLRKKLAESAAGLRTRLGEVSPKNDSLVSPDASGALISKRLAVRQ